MAKRRSATSGSRSSFQFMKVYSSKDARGENYNSGELDYDNTYLG